MPLISVIVPTKNEAANIGACLGAFKGREGVELIVVDNRSDDATCAIARECGAKVFEQGPERSAQRNRGAREAAAEWLMILDADMIMPAGTFDEILSLISAPGGPNALYVREFRTGDTLRAKARNFERGFYDATCIDAVRVVEKRLFDSVGGYDETIVGNEDWELDIRLKQAGMRAALTKGFLVHNERALTVSRLFAKKVYYGGTSARYRAKWPGHPDVRRQFSPWYRFVGVFVENGKWRRLLRHPILAAAMMCERFLVGAAYLKSRFAAKGR